MITIVVPVFNEEESIVPFVNAANNALARLDEEFCLLFVDDGSTDSSVKLIEEQLALNRNIKLLRLSQNIGKQYAIDVGLRGIDCEAYIVIDVDLQDPLDYMLELVQKWRGGADAVITVRADYRESSLIYSLCARFYYIALNALCGFKVNRNSNDFSLISRDVRDQILLSNVGRGFVFRCSRDLIAKKQQLVTIVRDERRYGVPSYNLYKRVRLFLLSVIAYVSFVRLYFISFMLFLGGQWYSNTGASFLYSFIAGVVALVLVAALRKYYSLFSPSRYLS